MKFKTSFSIIMENFVEFSQMIEDPRFGEIFLYYNKENPNEKLMKKVKKCSSQEEYELSKE